ncbi:ABC transporter permease [Planomicrobium sp. YIM 101495]|uniref:FtsX-like permease family protein n=1 Tax=Planomicrobium sp. YIM 101495 TaxID=2665160 RepID=UPI0018ABAFB2
MTNRFFSSLAIRNIRSNSQLYIPYGISAVAVIAMFYMMMSLIGNDFVQGRSSTLPSLFAFGALVIGVFSAIFILYTNSFLIKRRLKEFGLYGVLGLERKHIIKILFFETLFTGAASIVLGLLAGQIFGRLVFMLLNYLMRLPGEITYTSSLSAAAAVLALFTIIFAAAFLYNLLRFTIAKPVRLLKGGNEGEKEPKGSLLLFLLGLGLVGGGYWISLTIDNALDALVWFFGAVLLVIAGTYLLFMSGSIFVLKALKNNDRIYYRPGAFISISGMIYRMKQNAAGLANITVLACMVIIAVATTVALYAGAEETLNNRFPAENNWTVYGEEMSLEEVQALYEQALTELETEAAALDLEVVNLQSLRYQMLFGSLNGTAFEIMDSGFTGSLPLFTQIMPLEDYNRMNGTSHTLAEGEMLVNHSAGPYEKGELEVGGKVYSTQPADSLEGEVDQGITETMTLVVADLAEIDAIMSHYRENSPGAITDTLSFMLMWDTEGEEAQETAYVQRMEQVARYNYENISNYEGRERYRAEWYSTNGGFLFLGVFLGLLFTIGAMLITYFKQVSEGFDDRRKFQIMQKVGLDKDMIKDSTRHQLVWMFFLPLVTASVHVLFAYPIVRQLLLMFGITNEALWLWSLAGVIVAFALLYYLIYRITSRVYYRIVQ